MAGDQERTATTHPKRTNGYSESVRRLSVLYNGAILFSALALVCLIFGLAAFQYHSERSRELQSITISMSNRLQSVEDFLRGISRQVGRMAIWGEDYLEAFHGSQRDPLSGLIQYDAAGDYFHLHRLEPPYNRGNTGNIFGLGSPSGRGKTFYDELDMAAGLFRLHSVVHGLLPYVTRIYYVSNEKFIASFPWVFDAGSMKLHGPSTGEAFDRLFGLQLWQAALPEDNPRRQSYWTNGYADPGSDKFVVSNGVPLYQGEKFLGVMAADVSLGVLNNLAQQLAFGGGRLLLVDRDHQVLGDSGWTGIHSEKTQTLAELFPKAVNDRIEGAGRSFFRSLYASGYNIFQQPLEIAPWYLIYILPESTITRGLLPLLGVYMGVVIGLVAFLVFAQVVIRRQFVMPAISLAQFIETHAVEGQGTAAPVVPPQWMQWFDRISETFKLKQVEQHLRSFMESASGFVVYQLGVDENDANKTQLLFVSQSIREVMGLPDPYDFDAWFTNAHPEDREALTRAASDSIAQSRPFDATIRVYHGGKHHWVWIHAHATPVFNNAGKPIYYNGLIVDVTDQRKAEGNLKRELAKFQTLYELATAMTAERTLDDNLSHIVGEGRELLNADIAYVALLDPSDRSVYVRSWSGLQTDAIKTRRLPEGAGLAGKIMKTGEPFLVRNYYEDVESTFHDSARKEGIVSGLAAPIKMGKTPLGVFFVYNRHSTVFAEIDLTTLSLLASLAAVEISRSKVQGELQKAREELEMGVEERTTELVLANEKLSQEIWERRAAEQALAASEQTLRTIFNSSRDPIIIHRGDGGIVEVNDRALEVFQVTRQDALQFSLVHDYSSEDNPTDELPGLWQRVLAGENQFFPWKARRPYDGSVFHVEMFLCKLFTSRGDLILANIHDVTERKRAEDELRFQKAYAEQLFYGSPDAIAVIDLDDRISRINPAFTTLFGYSDQEAQGRLLNDLVAGSDSREEADAISQLVRLGKLVDCDAVRLRKNGSLVDVSVVGSSILVDGVRVGYFGIYRDNTDRSRALRALRQSEELYRTLVESIPYGISEMDANGVITFVNSMQSRITGYSKEELVGMPALDLLVDEDQKKAFSRFGVRLLKDRPEPKAWFGTIAKKSKELLDVQVDWNYKTDETGLITGFITIFTDITDRKRAEDALRTSEEKYRLVVEHSAEGMCILQGWDVRFANPRVRSMMGYSQEELASMRLQDFLHPDDLPMADKFRLEILDGQSVKRHIIVRLVRKSGDILWTQVSGVLVTWKEAPAVLCFVTDITETRKMQEDLIQLEKLDSIGVLAGGIAHDFNNLLTAILGNISLARLGLHPDDKRSFRLGEAEKACHRARDLTQQLVAFAKGGAPVKQVVSLESLINETIEFSTRGTPCGTEVISSPDAWAVSVDPVQLRQVFANLFINACQAMPQGGQVQVRIENVIVGPEDPIALEAGRYVKVSVLDRGMGIPLEHQTRIFDPYFSTKPKGSGLGLATSYAVMKNHGGLITFDSREGEGATFYLYLRASDEPAVQKSELKGFEQPASKGKVLVMDDEEAIRSLTVDLLSLMGYDVTVSGDGAECIDLYTRSMASDKPFDVVILDLTIPGGMGGEEAMKRLLEIDPSVRAIVSSGYSDAPIMGEYAKYGFRAVIPKPYDIADLCRIIEAVIGRTAS